MEKTAARISGDEGPCAAEHCRDDAMNPRAPGAFLLSASFHTLLVGLIVMLNVESCQQTLAPEPILRLVAQARDNSLAGQTPNLGTERGLELDLPSTATRLNPSAADRGSAAPQPEPEPIEPESQPSQPQLELPAIKPAPAQETKPTPTPVPAARRPERKQRSVETKIRDNLRAAETKAANDAVRNKADGEKRMTKQDFDRLHLQRRVASASRSGTSTNVPNIDAKGLAEELKGGASANNVHSVRESASTPDGDADVAAYYTLFKRRILAAVDKPAGVRDNLSVTVEVFISATGRLSNAHILESSGSDEFDQAVLAAFSRVSMPEPPEHRAEPVQMTFRTKDVGQP